MNRAQLEHIIRAAAAVTDRYEIVVVGSQSILGAYPDAPPALLASMEADAYPADDPSLSDVIDGALGENSPFHDRFGYYAQGVGPETAVLPQGWKNRVVKIQNPNTDMKIGYCLEPHDLAASKLAAGRDKDFRFVEILLSQCMVKQETLLARLALLDGGRVPAEVKARLVQWVSARGA